MPVVGIPLERLQALLGKELSREELLEHLGHLGCDVEGITQLARVGCGQCGAVHEMTGSEEVPPFCDACHADLRAEHRPLDPLEVVRMELLAVRPDMFDPGGLARVLRGYLGLEPGAPHYPIAPPALTLHIDPSVRCPESYRPEIACAVLTDVALDADSLKVVMKLQENLHWAVGRDRKHASIGVYDLDKIRPDLTYTTADPDTFKFTPLGAPDAAADRAMTLRAILAEHPKGRAYAHLLEKHARYPLLKDSRGQVLAMPPIINSAETRVTSDTTRLFIDVTGLGARVVGRTLNIIVSSLLENLPAARLAGVRLAGPGPQEGRVTPDFTPQEVKLSPQHATRVLGVDLTAEQAAELLQRMRHDVSPSGPDELTVRVPAYRNDIIHEIDLIEDLAIAYGYHRVAPTLVPTFTVGVERPEEVLSEKARAALCGLGFSEVMTLVLTCPEEHDIALGCSEARPAVTVAHPVSSEQTMLRTSLLPGLLATFEHNITRTLPQRIFEVGDVTLPDAGAPTGALEQRRLACGVVAVRVGFEEAKALAEAILREFGRPWKLREHRGAPFLDGRGAAASWAGEDQPLLWFGEVHPGVLERFHLQNPAIVIEGNLELMGRRR